MDKIIKDVRVCQQAIMSHLLETDGAKPYLPVLEPQMFGPYGKIFEWIRDNGNEKTTEFYGHLSKNRLSDEFQECVLVEWYSTNVGAEIEKLLRYYYFDTRPSTKILDHLEEYNSKRDALSIIRTNQDSKKYSGMEI
jgi:hypothetical protein